MLWIALHLPRLSLEAFMATVTGTADAPIALIDTHRIAAANAAAQSLGVKPGLKRATALALAPQLVLGQADAVRDGRALEPVVHAALAFTPQVSLQPPVEPGRAADTVLLEVQASLRYFGGRERLLQRLQGALQPLGHRLQVSSAVTAQAAAVLARVEPPPHCADPAATRQAFEAAPVWLLGPGREHWEALQGMGLRSIADLLVLPRSGLARRFGEAMLAQIDAALGRRADPREPIVPPPGFESRLELFARADTTEQVLHGASVLLERLVAWLAAQHAFVRGFRLVMRHESRWQRGDCSAQATALDIALAEPSRDSAHLLVLLRETAGPAAVAGADARAVPAGPRHRQARGPEQRALSDGPKRQRRPGPVDRTPAGAPGQRAGAAARQRRRPSARTGQPGAGAEAKIARGSPPAMAATARRRGSGSAAAAAVPAQDGSSAGCDRPPLRPIWLQPAEPLVEKNSMPIFEGRPLKLLSGPERIEAGWWDNALAGRDYFIAEAIDGALVWIYRERLPFAQQVGQAFKAEGAGSGWFVQGRFG